MILAKIKKFLPFILFGIGLLVLVLVYFLVIKPSKKVEEPVGKADALIEIGLNERPIASLTPTADGHLLNLKVEKITISAFSMDYELLYQLPDGRTQGVPGTITLNNQKSIERKLLLGSESSGKFRYDEGVKEGTLTLRFRNDKGKLMVKYSTKFALVSNTKELATIDGKFKANLTKIPAKTFFVVMETFGVPEATPVDIATGPYGIFASSVASLMASIKLDSGDIYRYSGTKWENVTGEVPASGIFIASK